MELSQLFQFKKIAELENISKASAELHITQPALSRSLHKLEHELGANLFDRRNNRLVLNPVGSLVLNYVTEIADIVDSMNFTLAGIATQEVPIRIGSSSYVASRAIAPSLIQGQSGFEVSVTSLDQDQLFAAVTSRSVDLGLSAEVPQDESLNACYVLSEELLLSVPVEHPLSNAKKVRLEDLRGQKVLRQRRTNASVEDKLVDDLLKQQKISLREISYNDPIMFYNQLNQSSELAFVSNLESDLFASFGRRVCRKVVPLDTDQSQLDFYLVYRADAFSQLNVFIDWACSRSVQSGKCNVCKACGSCSRRLAAEAN